MGWMIIFMGFFFVIVSILKLLDLKGFANAFSQYDLIAGQSKIYSYLYPFIELFLGISYLLAWHIKVISGITLVIMVIGAIGVGQNLFFADKKVKCACLGTLIKIPLTKFTFVEDIVMALMALIVLLTL